MPSSKKRKCDKTSPLFSVNSHGPPSSHGLSSFPSEILGEIFSFGGIKIFKAFTRLCKEIRKFSIDSFYSKEKVYFNVTPLSIGILYRKFDYSNVELWHQCKDWDVEYVCSRGKIRRVNLSGCTFLTDRVFKCFGKVESLCMEHCGVYVTGNAFKYLKNLKTLDMSCCNQTSITDESFKQLKGLRSLSMRWCSQKTITDDVFKHLGESLRELNIRGCKNLTIGMFKYFDRIKKLDASICEKLKMTDKNFEHLKKIQHLNLKCCDLSAVTDKAFENLKMVEFLNISHCKLGKAVTDKAFGNLKRIHTLRMRNCNGINMTDKAFINFKGIYSLDISGCNQGGITDRAFESLQGIYKLDIGHCDSIKITDLAFKYLKGINTLDMSTCRQPGITDKIFEYLKGVQFLSVPWHTGGISTVNLNLLEGIKKLTMHSKNGGTTEYTP